MFTSTQQGVLAGCTHATTLLTVLTFRAIGRVHSVYSDVMPRALVDGSTFQWTGRNLTGSASLKAAVRMFSSEVSKLGMIIKPEKSGWLASHKKAMDRFKRGAQSLRLSAKKWMRNLGHEMPGTRPVRKQAAKR